MTNGQTRPTGQPPNRDGFVLPAVIFTMAILGLLAVAALSTANDEHRASRAIRESGAALYAAEAGAYFVLGTQIDTSGTMLLDSLAGTLAASGDSADLGWDSLPSGAAYHAVLRRMDGGGKNMYLLTVVGRGAGPWGGERLISLALTSSAISIAMTGAFQFGGNATIGEGGGFNGGPPVTIDGNDNVPPGWGAVCDPPGPAMPGLVVPDITAVNFQDSPNIMGDPAIVEAPFDTLAFDAQFAALLAQATIVFPPGQLGDSYQIQPVENPPGVCDTSVNTNWGAPEDPTHPCFDYFPIIYVPDGINFKTQPDHAGQGILLVGDGEAQLENGFSWYGLIMAKGDIQVEQGKSGCEPANIYGGLYTRNDLGNVKLHGPQWYPANITCNGTEPGSSLFYSSCAMKRVGEALAGGGGSALKPIGSRAWSEF